jgi:hypothetical protein
MAKAPSSKVAATSGQGVSRLAYQKAYSLGKAVGISGDRAPKVSGGQSPTSRNDYAKTSISKAPKGTSETYAAPEVEMGKPPKSSVSLKKAETKKYEVPKEDSGFIKGKGK